MAQRAQREGGKRMRRDEGRRPAGKGATRRSTRGGAPGRYTAPTPRAVRHSPPWYPWVLLGLAVAGVAVIIVNYAGGFPHSPSNWYTLGALIALVAAAVLATNYR